jgi:signal transduction histidine kinase
MSNGAWPMSNGTGPMSDVIERAHVRVDRRSISPGAVYVLGAVCLITTAGVASVLADSPASARGAALPVLVIGASIVFGSALADVARARETRFASALIAAGLLWALSALTAASGSVLSSVGHLAFWGAVMAIAFLLLSYPSGQLETRADRGLFVGATLLTGLVNLPTVLVTHGFPGRSPWSACASGCPSNAFSLVQPTPAVVHGVVVPTMEALTAALFVGVAAAVVRRGRNAGPSLGRFYLPIAAIAVSEAVVTLAYFWLRRSVPESVAVTIAGWIIVLFLPSITLARGVGRVYRRLYAAGALDRIAHSVRPDSDLERVRQDLADAIADPSLQIVEPRPGSPSEWVDKSGASVPGGPHRSGRITEVADDTSRIAVIHDPALADEPMLVHIAGSFALAALEKDRLSAKLQDLVTQLADSRKRRLTAQLDERRKIERDLHDGAQQRLLALRVKLELSATELDAEHPAQARRLRGLGQEVEATIDEVRALARGIYPAVLARTGLEQSLRTVSHDAPLPTTVHARGLARYAHEVEATVYFSCSEALQNACKHARGATGVTISLWDDGQLHFAVCDDGAAFDAKAVEFGTGLTNVRDRLVALGGTMRIHSIPGRGTVLSGRLPVR